MKYLIGLGAVLAAAVGYFLLSPPSPAVISQNDADSTVEAELVLEDIVASVREGLPAAITDTLTLNDAVFFPRMRILEYVYVSSAPNIEDIQSLIEGRAETLCLEARDMFGMDVTLRNSFEDLEGNVLQRIYLLDEDCQRFY